MGLDERFRQTSEFARHSGYAFGFPNFHQADYGNGTVHGSFLVKSGAATHRDVPKSVLGGHLSRENVPDMIRAATGYAQARGYPGALPTFHHADYGQGLVYGVLLFDPRHAEFRDIPKSRLGDVDLNDTGAMFRAANDYVVGQEPDFKGAIPTFHQADYRDGRGPVRGHVLLRNHIVDWFDLRQSDLRKYIPETAPTVRGQYSPSAPAFLQAAHRYAERSGYVGAFLNFHRASYPGRGLVYGTNFLRHASAEFRSVPPQEYNQWGIDRNDVQAVFRAVDDYARRNGYPAGFPNYKTSLTFSGDITLLKPGSVVDRDVPTYILGNVKYHDIAGTFTEVADYANRHGFPAAFPNFHRATYSGGEVCGVKLLRPGHVTWKDVSGSTYFPPSPPSTPGGGTTPRPEVTLSAGFYNAGTWNRVPALSWTSKNADKVEIDNGIGAVPTQGQRRIYPQQDTTYTITATRGTQTARASATFQANGTHRIVLFPNQYDYSTNGSVPTAVAMAPERALITGVKNVTGSQIVLAHQNVGNVLLNNGQTVDRFDGMEVRGPWSGNKSWTGAPTGTISIDVDWRVNTQ
ncbi:hypothetical protein SAMN04487947_1370 [Halogeometricum rufum]|uniref:Uncharacterized protein n=1 Tax=Halogeometricum rufum TaxID=553469 RepID=A0A1I6GLY4_9EURY|nr:hypothetical protein [Halogeometricum rufum]SFR43242.1 hypothetical protein SAMN04487947_1370 [Halogeometricum rufum]